MASNSIVTACIPYFRCRKYIRRAVQSLLGQTFRKLTVIVVNDGDPNPPWDLLFDIRDPRLVRFDMKVNRGPYFATAVALNSSTTPFFLIQDGDDWSSPQRVEASLSSLERHRADFVFSAARLYRETSAGLLESYGVDWPREPETTLTPQFRYRLPHHGMWRSQVVKRIGGYYGGFPMGYDQLLMNALLMIGKYSYVRDELYHRLVRRDSLTMSPRTGYKSRVRSAIRDDLASIYSQLYQLRSRFLSQSIGSTQFVSGIRKACLSYLTAKKAADLQVESQRLASHLRGR
jgi:glycosyltransferase involved in cell wall biosynthesis